MLFTTVVQMLNQGTTRKRVVHRFRAHFFPPFFVRAKKGEQKKLKRSDIFMIKIERRLGENYLNVQVSEDPHHQILSQLIREETWSACLPVGKVRDDNERGGVKSLIE